ncbi:MAG: Transposase [Pelotomaculum sp. PtaB.Bin117]|nr:MAG: Transposase [Pelotomaculum sp. PtaB.Bin117]OPY61619.1 MAG: Transposase [Pelotomaculum sp. PtaU1.Bin065]
MNAVGIDVSKGKSMVAAMRPFGEVVLKPFEVRHTASELRKLADRLKSLDGETRVIMEYTGRYYQPIARYLHEAGIFVSAVHAKLIHDYGNNSIRKIKTDKADAVKIANYGLANWAFLKQYSLEDDTRLLLKTCNRQYGQYMKLRVALKNNLIALLDQTFPGINTLFSSPARPDGHEKWVDFAAKFWHCACVSKLTKAQKCSGWLHCCRSIPWCWPCAASEISLVPNSWQRSVMCAVSRANSLSLLLLGSMLRLFSPALSNPKTVLSLNAVHLFSVKRSSWS